MQKVAVIILNYRVKDLSLQCIKSVLASDYKNLQVIAVDNNSQDGFEAEARKLADIEFIQTGANLGFTGGNNLGIKQALSNGAEYVFVLNPDTTIVKDAISKLIEGLESSGAGIAGPKIYFENSKNIWYAGGGFDKNNVLGSHIGVNEKDVGQYDTVNETDYVTGAAMMVKKEVFEKIGLFDERYFLYYEDSDFCFRAKQAGFKIMYIPNAIVYHANAKSTGLGSPLQDYYITRNRMLFAAKFLPIRTRFALLREGIRNLNIPARKKALVDFWLNRLGNGGTI